MVFQLRQNKTFRVGIIILLVFFCNTLKAQNPTDADVKTALIYNFLKYTNYSSSHSKDTFYVVIYGEDNYLLGKLLNLQDKKVNGKTILIQKRNEIDNTEPIDLLYIFNENNFEISPIFRQFKGKSLLLVTDRYDNKQEVMINFIHEGNNKVRFEINTKNILEAGLSISPKLLLLGGTELDIRELYKDTEKSLVNERERTEQIENELKNKMQEINRLTNLLSNLFIKIDTLNSIINSNIYYIRIQESKLDSLKEEQLLLTSDAANRKKALDLTNLALLSRNKEVRKLDINLSDKQKQLEFAVNSLQGLKLEIEDKEAILKKQKGKIQTQQITLFFFMTFLILLAVFLYYVYKNYRIKQSKNIELERRNHQINRQNEKIQAQASQLKNTNLELQKLSIVAEKINNAVIIMDNKGNLEWVNDGFVRMFGYTFDEYIQKSGVNFISASSNYDPLGTLKKCLIEKKAISYESEMLTKSNIKKWLHSTITPVLDNNNEVIKLVAIDTDITKLKDAENKIIKKNIEIEEKADKLRVQAEDLTKANRELEIQKNRAEVTLIKLKNTQSQLVANEKMASLGQLTSGIAHEINNPINYISSSIEGLRNILGDIKLLMNKYDKLNIEREDILKFKKEIEYDDLLTGFDELTSNIKMGVDRTKEIVNSLRTFSRIDEDNFSIVDVNETINSTIILIEKQYKDRINIIKEYNEIPTIEGITGSLSQVFLNILVNAIQSIKGMGDIRISTSTIDESEKRMAKIGFTDTGCGMTKEVQEKIFEPFYTTKDVGEGTGLGLSIVYSIVKQHNGRIEVKSKPEKGTSFIIYLPIKRT